MRPLDDSAAEQPDHASVDMHQCHLMPINTNIADRKARPHNIRAHNSHSAHRCDAMRWANRSAPAARRVRGGRVSEAPEASRGRASRAARGAMSGCMLF
jgi:hypothetical protein